MKTYYDILKVNKNASQDQIKTAYRHLASSFHPDKYPENTKFAEDMMKEINAAYAVLSDLSKKNAYDEWLSHQNIDYQNTSTSDKSNSDSSKSFKISDSQAFLLIGLILGCIYFSTNNQNNHAALKPEVENTQNDTQPQFEIENLPKRIDIPNNFLSKSKISVIENPDQNFRIFVDSGDYIVDLKYSDQLWRLRGKNQEEIYNDHLSRVISISKNSIDGYHIIQTHCGGSGCSSYSHHLIDLEHKVISEIPIYGKDIKLKIFKGNLIASGEVGVDEVGDPRIESFIYQVNQLPNEFGVAWTSTEISRKYSKLYGAHPADFFSDKNLRQNMIDQLDADTFKLIRDRSQVANKTYVENGHLLVMQGCKVNQCGDDSAITIIDMETDSFTTVIEQKTELALFGNSFINVHRDGDHYLKIFNNFLIGKKARVKIISDEELILERDETKEESIADLIKNANPVIDSPPSLETIKQGVYQDVTQNKKIAPLQITTSSGSENYFVKLVNIETNEVEMTFYINGGHTYETKVPLGNYRIKYASGKVWHGEEKLFGPETRYSEADKTFNFKIENNRISGYTIELILQRNGNMHTKSIGANQF